MNAYIRRSFFSLICLMLFAANSYSALINSEGSPITVKGGDTSGGQMPGITYGGTGRIDIGWGGNGGGNLAAYSMGHADRPGQFNFVYGGSPTIGLVKFNHYDGTAWTPRMALDKDGNLTVGGSIATKSINVKSTLTWPDYVFKKEFELMPIEQLDDFIQKNGHLPGIDTAEKVNENGIDLGKTTRDLVEKVEQLTLYVIQLKKQNDQMSEELSQLKAK